MIEILQQIEGLADVPLIVVQWYMIWRLWEELTQQSIRQARMLAHLAAIRNGDNLEIEDCTQ